MRALHSCTGMVALGHILLDIIGDVERFPEQLGDVASGDIHIDCGSMRRIMDAFLASSGKVPAAFSRSLGGGAAVTSMIAANLGLESTFLGSIGKDFEGEFLKGLLTKAGTRFLPTYSDKGTGIFLSLKDKKGNEVLRVSPSAARDVRSISVDDSELKQGHVLYLDGLLIDSEPWLNEIAFRAKKNNMIIAMDFSTPSNAVTNRSALITFAEKYCDIVFANEHEVEAVYGRELSRKIKRTLVLVEKRGRDGAILYNDGNILRQDPAEVAVKDTTCAGDALAAGFIMGMSKGLDYGRCLSLGSKVASIAIQYGGSGYDQELMKKSIVEELD